MTLRNEQLVQQMERHPLKATLARILDCAEAFQGDIEFVAANRDLSQSGREKARRSAVEKAVRDIRDLRKPIDDMKATLKAKRAVVKQPAFPSDDIVGFLRRQELRAAVRSLPLEKRIGILTGDEANPDLLDAVLEQPPLISGFDNDPNMLQIYAKAQQERLRSLFKPQLAEIDRLETTIAEADSIAGIARSDVSAHSGLPPEHFEAYAKPIEDRQGAPWIIRNGTNVQVVDLSKRGTSEMYRAATPDEIRDGKTYANEQEYLADRAA